MDITHTTNTGGHRLPMTCSDPLPFPSDEPERWIWTEDGVLTLLRVATVLTFAATVWLCL